MSRPAQFKPVLFKSLLHLGLNSAANEGPPFQNQKFKENWSSCGGAEVMNPRPIHEAPGLIPGLAQWVKDPSLP